jgi:hypothetical protein
LPKRKKGRNYRESRDKGEIIMEKFFTPFVNLIKDMQPFTWILVAIVLIIGGVLLFVGGEKGREKLKAHAGWVLIGILFILGAIPLAEYLVSKFTF